MRSLPFPDNPNGADANVAGVCDPSGRVFGLMPHPERHIDPTQHPLLDSSRRAARIRRRVGPVPQRRRVVRVGLGLEKGSGRQ